jgi:hypothetical protein
MKDMPILQKKSRTASISSSLDSFHTRPSELVTDDELEEVEVSPDAARGDSIPPVEVETEAQFVEVDDHFEPMDELRSMSSLEQSSKKKTKKGKKV